MEKGVLSEYFVLCPAKAVSSPDYMTISDSSAEPQGSYPPVIIHILPMPIIYHATNATNHSPLLYHYTTLKRVMHGAALVPTNVAGSQGNQQGEQRGLLSQAQGESGARTGTSLHFFVFGGSTF